MNTSFRLLERTTNTLERRPRCGVFPDKMIRCAICHDDLPAPRLACEACRSLAHVDCRDDLGRCPTLGCVRSRPGVPPVGRSRPLPADDPRELSLRGCFSGCLLSGLIVLGVLVFGVNYDVGGPCHSRSKDLAARVRLVEAQLLSYVHAIESGELAPVRSGTGTFTPPALPSYGPRITSVFVDPRGDVVFGTHGDREWNEGFVHHTGDAPVVGTNHGHVLAKQLFGEWWFFHDSGYK